MADQPADRIEPLRRLVEATDDPAVLDLLTATVELVSQDTKQVLDQTHIARDIAARTKAGDWFGNTELGEILAGADHFLRVYKRQREEIGQLKASLQAKRGQLAE